MTSILNSSSKSATTTNAAPTGPVALIQKCHILLIPAELRLIIYEHYFRDFEPSLRDESAPRKATLQPSLLHACSVFEVEALSLYKLHLETRRSKLATDFEAVRAHMAAWRNSSGPIGGQARAFAVAQEMLIMKRKRNEWQARDLPFAMELRTIDWLHAMEEIRNSWTHVADMEGQ